MKEVSEQEAGAFSRSPDLGLWPIASGPVFGPPLGTSISADNKAKKGRPRKIDARLGEILDLLVVEKLSIRQIADMVGVSHMTIYRALERSDVEMLIPG